MTTNDRNEGGDMSRERHLSEAFIELTDTLVGDYDVVELLHRLADHCLTLLDAAAAGLVLADQRGHLRVLASSSDQTRLLELFQLQTDEGPCVDCFRSGAPVAAPGLADAAALWPRFAPEALRQGFRSVHALPMRLRSETIGALNLFGTSLGPLSESDVRIGQALADAATIGILHERAVRRGAILIEQLQAALNSRVVIEQAKGVLAERRRVTMDRAFTLLRDHARRHQVKLTDTARGIVDGSLDTSVLFDRPANLRPRP